MFHLLPKFLIADDEAGQRTFVVHCHEPLFIAEVVHAGTEIQLDPYWPEPEALHMHTPASSIESSGELRALMREATEFYQRTFSDPEERN